VAAVEGQGPTDPGAGLRYAEKALMVFFVFGASRESFDEDVVAPDRLATVLFSLAALCCN
jgi:hypothetical protein